MTAAITALIFAAAMLPNGAIPQHLKRPGYVEKVALATSDAALLTGIEPVTLVSLYRHESLFSERARSPVGAVGIPQILPRAWPKLPVRRVWDQVVSGALVLRHYLRRCKRLPSAITAYRSGSCGPANEETLKVLRTRARLKRLADESVLVEVLQ